VKSDFLLFSENQRLTSGIAVFGEMMNCDSGCVLRRNKTRLICQVMFIQVSQLQPSVEYNTSSVDGNDNDWLPPNDLGKESGDDDEEFEFEFETVPQQIVAEDSKPIRV
jgi:hypothetical protein